MGESYNSLGSRVLRHFRHYITGSKHIWLPGDFFDPTMSSALMKASRPDDSSECTKQTPTTHETGESSQKQSGETNTMTSQDTPMTSLNMPTTSHHTSTTSNCPEKIEDNIVHINQLDLIAHDNEIAERGPDREVIAPLGKDNGDSRDCAREQVLESSSGVVGEIKDNVDGKLSAHNGHILHNGVTDSWWKQLESKTSHTSASNALFIHWDYGITNDNAADGGKVNTGTAHCVLALTGLCGIVRRLLWNSQVVWCQESLLPGRTGVWSLLLEMCLISTGGHRLDNRGCRSHALTYTILFLLDAYLYSEHRAWKHNGATI